MPRAHLVALTAAMAALAACSRVEFLVVEPRSVEFQRVGETRNLSVIGKNRQGMEYPKILVAWETRDARVATVERGMVKAVGPGRTLIVVRTNTLTAEVPVEVILVDKIEVRPERLDMSLESGGVKLDVKAHDNTGRDVRGRAIHTKCAKVEVCSSSGDTVFPIDVGETTVEVVVDEKSLTLPVRVVEKAAQLEALKKRK